MAIDQEQPPSGARPLLLAFKEHCCPRDPQTGEIDEESARLFIDRLRSPSFGNGELSGSDLVLAHLVKDFALDLAKGKLEAWGRVGSPWGPWIKIPADTWTSLRYNSDIDWCNRTIHPQYANQALFAVKVVLPVTKIALALLAPSEPPIPAKPSVGLDQIGSPAEQLVVAAPPSTSKARRRKGGRKHTYDWPAFEQEAIRVLEDEGLPVETNEEGWRCQADLEESHDHWCEDNWPKVPVESQIRTHTVKAIEKFCEGRKGQ